MGAEPFSFVVVAADIPAAGRHFRLEPGSEERARIAEALGIADVTALRAEIDVRPARRRGYDITGVLTASVVQACVVTLDPVAQDVHEEIELTLTPADNGRAPRRGEAEMAEEDDEKRIYRNGRLDLGALVTEHLALGLDPYPRAPGVEFPGHIEDDAAADVSPF